MKSFLFGLVSFIVLFIHSLCASDTILCELLAERSNSLEYYCENFQLPVPSQCALTKLSTVLTENVRAVNRLKIGGCDWRAVAVLFQKFPNVREIDISHSAHASLNWLDLVNFKQLRKLNASHNAITEIPRLFLANKSLNKMAEIDLSFNKLRSIESNYLEGAAHLQRIHLAHNRIAYIDDRAFVDAIHLEYADLSNNRIQTFDAFRDSNKLREIHLENNPIVEFYCGHFADVDNSTVYISWKNVQFFSTNCPGTKYNVILNGKYEGVLRRPNGRYEIHCNPQSFENMLSFKAARNTIENASQLLQCFGSAVRNLYFNGKLVGKLRTNILRRFLDTNRRINQSNAVNMDDLIIKVRLQMLRRRIWSNWMDKESFRTKAIGQYQE